MPTTVGSPAPHHATLATKQPAKEALLFLLRLLWLRRRLFFNRRFFCVLGLALSDRFGLCLSGGRFFDDLGLCLSGSRLFDDLGSRLLDGDVPNVFVFHGSRLWEYLVCGVLRARGDTRLWLGNHLGGGSLRLLNRRCVLNLNTDQLGFSNTGGAELSLIHI